MQLARTENAMKTTTLAVALFALVACSKDKKVEKPTPEPDKPVAVTNANDKLLERLTADQQVSPTLALSGDIVQMCGIKASETANPNFDYDKDELAPEDRAVLDQLATCLMTGALKGRALNLVGRADPRGTEEYNLGLGSRRAQSVSTYLTRLGVGSPQLAVNTRGSLDATGTDEAGWAKDRRVDITLQ
jgi:peptidoglycan-associated lipoprotein